MVKSCLEELRPFGPNTNIDTARRLDSANFPRKSLHDGKSSKPMYPHEKPLPFFAIEPGRHIFLLFDPGTRVASGRGVASGQIMSYAMSVVQLMFNWVEG